MATYSFKFSEDNSTAFVAQAIGFYGATRAQISQAGDALSGIDPKAGDDNAKAVAEATRTALNALKSKAISSQQWCLHELLGRFPKLDDAGKAAAVTFLKSIRGVLAERFVDKAYEVGAFGRSNGKAEENDGGAETPATTA